MKPGVLKTVRLYLDSIRRLGLRRLVRRVRNRILVEQILDRRLARRGLRVACVRQLGARTASHLLERARRSCRSNPMFLFDRPADAVAQVRARCPGAVERTLAQAHRLLEGEYSIMGQASVRMPFPPTDWQVGEPSDPEWIHALHRHRLIVPVLARALAYTGDRRYLGGLEAFVRSWIAANPAGTPICFQAMSLSVRLDGWAWMYRILLGCDAFTPEFHALVVGSTVVQVAQLLRRLEYDQCGNHLIYNFWALRSIVSAMPFLPEAAKALALAERGLREQLLVQFSDDGMHREQSTAYHIQMTRLYLQWAWLRGQQGRPLGGELLGRIRRAAEACSLFDTSRGPVQFSDVFYSFIDWTTTDDLRAVRWLSAGLWGLPWPCEGSQPGETVAWQVELDQRHSPTATGALACARSNGYCSVRCLCGGHEQLLVFDCGPHGMNHIPGHAHGDALSLVFWVDGRPVLADPGTLSYAPDPASMGCKRTGAHNTVCLAGQDQAELWGFMRWGFLPRVELHRLDQGRKTVLLEGSHDGYSRLGTPCVHWRKVVVVASQGMVVEDRVLSGRTWAMSLCWNLGPEVLPYRDGPALRLECQGAFVGTILALQAGQPLPLTVRPYVYCREYGTPAPAERVVVEGFLGARTDCVRTFLLLQDEDAPPAERARHLWTQLNRH